LKKAFIYASIIHAFYENCLGSEQLQIKKNIGRGKGFGVYKKFRIKRDCLDVRGGRLCYTENKYEKRKKFCRQKREPFFEGICVRAVDRISFWRVR